ncbi:MAG: Stk1 family PASTA domain-containing Ser/Thr kinase [Actinobacteria bacterium]|nr:MAG: Stk1 family PASTA domain-containing Ser/Thr kinase [Actinomycetota bacterium]
MAVSDSLIDTLFDGRYRIMRKLGAGGMADVYLAEDQELGRRVAIKILNDRHANDDQFIERFRREAKNAAALNHPNIVSIYDRGNAEDTYYIAMEFLDGRSLKELIVGRGAAPINVAIEYARQILSALRFAHRHGIVHRDIKPHNVLVDGEGRVKVTDFGIARAGTSQMTETGSIVGTAQYLSPEQARGGEVDPRSDLYSLGVVLYELLTGKTPFDGETPVEIAMKHLSTPPKPPSKLRPDIPPELDKVVLRALAKSPDDRYQSADEMEADLERVARGAPVSAATASTQVLRIPPPAAAADSTAATMIAPPSSARAGYVPPPVVEEEEFEERGGPERPLWPWLVAAAFVIAAAIAGFFVWHELSGSKTMEPVKLYVGEPQAQAERQIRAAHLVPEVKKGSSESYKKGIVFNQNPSAGSHVEKGGTVTISVSSGPPKVSVPDVKGQQWTDAQQALTDQGLVPVERIVPGNTKGQVTATDPPAGKSVPKGSKVRVNVMSGPAHADVPNVVGDTLAQAIAALHQAGLNPNPTFVDSTAPQNQVIHQTPAPGTSATKGSSVALQVSNGPPQVGIPPVVGETAQQAVTDLEGAGFSVTQQYVAVADPSQDGIVQSQSPEGGSQATKGSTVTIVIGQHSPGPPPTTTTTG